MSKKVPLPEWCVSVKQALIRNGDMSITELAQATGYSRPYMSAVCNGINRPSEDVKRKVEEVLGMNQAEKGA